MITAIEGILKRVGEDRVSLSVGPMTLELLIAAADVPLLEGREGEEITFHTTLYIEGDASGGNSIPRLIGFLRESDKSFFLQFITVKGIGPRKALKAMMLPAAEVAHAIELKDARTLTKLPQIGKRAAEQIIAELAGKVGRYVGTGIPIPTKRAAAVTSLSPVEEDAVSALVALGERRQDAEALLDRVKSIEFPPAEVDQLIREMLRLRAGR
jgi:Holliday junction DNA helicase RuvA